MTKIHKGSCLCSAVKYELMGDLRDSVACHCIQCRKTSGHYFSATQVTDENLKITNAEGLKWFQSSEAAERGFCDQCGSSLFWRENGVGKTSVLSGTIDGPTGLKEQRHIYVASKGDYYQLPEGIKDIQE